MCSPLPDGSFWYFTFPSGSVATKSIGFSTFRLFLETAFRPEVMVPLLSGDPSVLFSKGD